MKIHITAITTVGKLIIQKAGNTKQEAASASNGGLKIGKLAKRSGCSTPI